MTGKSIAKRMLGATAMVLVGTAAQAQETLNALVWCDHTDPALLEPFEKANNVQLNLKEYSGTGAAISILEQSRPGDWDVFVIDGIDVPRVVDMGLLAELPRDGLPVANIPAAIMMEDNNAKDGKLYAITEKYGFNAIAFNSSKVSAEEAPKASVMWSAEHAGKIAIYDYYLPIIGLAALSLGKDTQGLTSADLPEIRDRLFGMKMASRQVSDIVAVQTALASGDVDILVGGGEFVTAGLLEERPDLDWTIPEEGGVLWSQSIGVFAESEKKELAVKFVQYILSSEGQAALATSSCYRGMPANLKAGDLMTDAQKAAVHWDRQEDYIARSALYPQPDEDLDLEMQDIWTEMLQH